MKNKARCTTERATEQATEFNFLIALILARSTSLKSTFLQVAPSWLSAATVALTVALLLSASSALAAVPKEAPLVDPASTAVPAPSTTEHTRQGNVQQLILTNECTGCDLSGVTLTDAHLIGADLRNANLQFADLTGSNLEGADLTGANLMGANFTNTFLTNAFLVNAQLDDVNFSGAHLYYVDVTGASMNRLNLAGAQLRNTPIYVGGDEQPIEEINEGVPLEPIIPFEETSPVEPFEPALN